MSYSALLVPADSDKPIERVTINEPDDLKRLVGGYFQVLSPPDEPDITCWFNEEGKIEQLPRNERATALLEPGRWLQPGDYVAGDAVLTGEPDREGNTQGLREGWEKDRWPA
jgi:hypothetical protein